MITFDSKDPTSGAFNLIYSPFLEVYKTDKARVWSDAFFKILRTAIIADTLHKKGCEKVLKNDDVENQFLSLLFESFILYVRIIYDLSTDIIQQCSNNKIKKSFNDLLKKIKTGKIKDLDKNLSQYVDRYSNKFEDLKNMRDSLKRNSTADIYVKNKTFFVFLKYYDKKGQSHKILNKKLSKIILEQSMLLCLLGIYLKRMIDKKI